MSRLLPVLAGMVALLAYGLAEGYWTNRWTSSAALASAAERLRNVPSRVEGWDAEEQELDPRQAKQGEIFASVLRTYKHLATGEAVRVLLLCGRPGPISVHTPQVCLGGAGYALVRPAAREKPDPSEADEFWAGRFWRRGQAGTDNMEVYWSWNARGSWVASDGPRLAFAREKVLYKLYVFRPLNVAAEPDGKGDPAEEQASPVPAFLKAFLPQVSQSLFPKDPT